jgi:hypothetical protein
MGSGLRQYVKHLLSKSLYILVNFHCRLQPTVLATQMLLHARNLKMRLNRCYMCFATRRSSFEPLIKRKSRNTRELVSYVKIVLHDDSALPLRGA